MTVGVWAWLALVRQVIGIQPQSPLSWSCDGTRLAFVSSNFDICVLRSRSPSQLLPFAIDKLLRGHSGIVRSVAFHPSMPNVLASTGVDGVCVWDTDAVRKRSRSFEWSAPARSLSLECATLRVVAGDIAG